MTRLEANLQILELLKSYFEQYPDMRFIQALSMINTIDGDPYAFYEESTVTLDRIKEFYAN